jgi:hypothetical protein
MNLLISFHSIFQDKETSRRGEEVEDAGWEDLDVVGWMESSDGGWEDSEEEDKGHEEGAGLDDEGVG